MKPLHKSHTRSSRARGRSGHAMTQWLPSRPDLVLPEVVYFTRNGPFRLWELIRADIAEAEFIGAAIT
jgi:hypothetical protein